MAISYNVEDQYPSIFNLTQPALVNDFGWMLLKRGMGNGERGMGNGEWGMRNSGQR